VLDIPLALAKRFHLLLVDIESCDAEPALEELDHQRQANIPESDNADPG
jgi:hypothetical protein